MDASIPYNGALTREQFLFHEMRTTARLLSEGLTDAEIVEAIVKDNLFQYPTERSLESVARACLRRLHALNDDDLVRVIVSRPAPVAKQVCLYAMMRQNRLVWEFMIAVIGEKYRTLDSSFGRIDVNSFFTRLQEQDDGVRKWKDSTIARIKSVLIRILVENEYLDDNRSTRLNPVWLDSTLEERIRKNGDEIALPAFNRLS